MAASVEQTKENSLRNGQHFEHRRGPSKEELRDGFQKMRRLAWATLIYQIFSAAILGSLMGGSQAMKTEWLENMLAVVPPLGVLLTWKTENHQPDNKHPFGYHRSGTVAFMAAAFAILGVGCWLFFESLMKLIHHEYPSIGGFNVFGHTIWHGWLMMAAMGLTAIPQIVLGKMKTPVAQLLHDKALHADAEMNRANWMTNGGGLIGLALVAFGFWWGDSLAALLISCDIIRDGWKNVANSLSDVMDHHPQDLENDRQQPVVADAIKAVKDLPFVDDVQILMREHGRYLFAEVFVQPNDRLSRVTDAALQVREAVMTLDWRIQHLCVEFTEDARSAANVRTREELEIEEQG
jgi:cation diffusion facilitator family transporter